MLFDGDFIDLTDEMESHSANDKNDEDGDDDVVIVDDASNADNHIQNRLPNLQEVTRFFGRAPVHKAPCLLLGNLLPSTEVRPKASHPFKKIVIYEGGNLANGVLKINDKQILIDSKIRETLKKGGGVVFQLKEPAKNTEHQELREQSNNSHDGAAISSQSRNVVMLKNSMQSSPVKILTNLHLSPNEVSTTQKTLDPLAPSESAAETEIEMPTLVPFDYSGPIRDTVQESSNLQPKKRVQSEKAVVTPQVNYVDISSILGTDKPSEPFKGCGCYIAKRKQYLYRGFTMTEMRKPTCLKSLYSEIASEENRIAKLKESINSNFISCNGTMKDLLPEENPHDKLITFLNKEAIPVITNVLTKVSSVPEKKKKRDLAQHEEALLLIKKGLEIMKRCSVKVLAGKKRKGRNASNRQETKANRNKMQQQHKLVKLKNSKQIGRKRGRPPKQDKGVQRSNVLHRKMKTQNIKMKNQDVEKGKSSADDLLVLTRVDILNNVNTEKKKRGRKKKI